MFQFHTIYRSVSNKRRENNYNVQTLHVFHIICSRILDSISAVLNLLFWTFPMQDLSIFKISWDTIFILVTNKSGIVRKLLRKTDFI